MYGINANYDSTAASQGAPLTAAHRSHEDELISTIGDGKEDTGKNNLQDSSQTEGGGSPAETLGKEGGETDHDDDPAAEMQRRGSVVQALARSYSRRSGAANPFVAEADSPLNPASENFSPMEWAKAIVDMVSEDGASFRSTGVCFQNMNVYGYGASTDYQKDVGNVWLSALGLARGIVKSNNRRIDILRHLDGLVHNGEMLVVLGPPGAGCSTFLKTIAGEMNGIFVDNDTYFNYQGAYHGQLYPRPATETMSLQGSPCALV